MAITVLEGDFGNFAYIEPAQNGIRYWAREPGRLPRREFAEVEKLEFLDENQISEGGFSPLWGAIGEEAIGPFGLLLGAENEKVKRTIYFVCTLKDGRYFKGSTSAQEFQNWRFLLTNKYAESINAVITAIAICIVIAIFVFFISLFS
jgi:hypothetical protein